jgi:hypothetical protein
LFRIPCYQIDASINLTPLYSHSFAMVHTSHTANTFRASRFQLFSEGLHGELETPGNNHLCLAVKVQKKATIPDAPRLQQATVNPFHTGSALPYSAPIKINKTE